MAGSSFAGKSVLITGGGAGIGRALAQQLAERGAKVWVSDRSEKAAVACAEQLRAKGADARGLALDVSDRARFEAVVAELCAARGRIDFLFNNAGVGIGGEVRDLSHEDWRKVIEVNLFGVIHGVEAAYPRMVEQGSGHIVNVASVAGLFPLPGEGPYVTSKYAVVGLSHSLRAEAAGLGVRVSCACPGTVATDIYKTSKVVNYDLEGILSLWPKAITPERCASVILRGVARNRATIIITGRARQLAWLARLSPALTGWATRRYMGQARAFRRLEEAPERD